MLLMVMETSQGSMETPMKGNGRSISTMVKEHDAGEMGQSTSVTLSLASALGRASVPGQTEPAFQEPWRRMSFNMGPMCGQMARFTQANGKPQRCMGKASSGGLMAAHMSGSTWAVYKKEKAHSHGRMATSTLVSGTQARDTAGAARRRRLVWSTKKSSSEVDRSRATAAIQTNHTEGTEVQVAVLPDLVRANAVVDRVKDPVPTRAGNSPNKEVGIVDDAQKCTSNEHQNANYHDDAAAL
mmetsp:Transcript_726/g.1523  ORF Transcript_726/g.1523 Transcript_726/m.1523 type:complete len:241 (+) Transcript_726:544-1266(+)